MWISTQGTGQSWKVLSALKGSNLKPSGGSKAGQQQKAENEVVVGKETLGNRRIEREPTKPAAPLACVIIKSIFYFILKKSPSFSDTLHGHTMARENQDLKQDSFKALMAVCVTESIIQRHSSFV